MTLSDTIRKILAKAPGPMSFGDIRAEISDSVAGNNISGTLFALAKSGEVIKERTGADGSGHFTYLLDPSQKPARAGKRVPPPRGHFQQRSGSARARRIVQAPQGGQAHRGEGARRRRRRVHGRAHGAARSRLDHLARLGRPHALRHRPDLRA